MRALITSTHVPYFPATGASARDHYLVKYLVREHEIKLVAPIYDQEQAELADALPDWIDFQPVYIPGRSEPESGTTFWLNRFVQPRLRRIRHIAFEPPFEIMMLEATLAALETELQRIDWASIDIVQIEHSLIGRLRQTVPAHIPTVLDCHNVHSAVREREYRAVAGRRRRIAEWTEWQKTRTYETTTLRSFDWLFACSEIDRARIRELTNSANCSVVPNGVDTEYFRRSNARETEPGTLLFVGTMSYEPNIEAAMYFCDQVFPIVQQNFPKTTVYIVGHNPVEAVKQLAGGTPGRIVVTGSVKDVRPYMESAAIGIVPLLNGGGTRLKILEMLSMEMAVVTTTVGCEGIDVTDGQHLFIADTAEAFAHAIKTLLQNHALRRQLGAQGRKLVQMRYEWAQIVRTVDDLWRSLAVA